MDALLSKATQRDQRRRGGCPVQKDKEDEEEEVTSSSPALVLGVFPNNCGTSSLDPDGCRCMDWGPMHIVYKLIRKKKQSWITHYLSWYNETAFSELIWTLERKAWQMMMDPDVLHNLRHLRTRLGLGLPPPTAVPQAWCPQLSSEKSNRVGTRGSSTMPLTNGPLQTWDVYWKPFRPPHPPERPPQESAVRPPTVLQVLLFLAHPRVLRPAPVAAEEEDLRTGPPGPHRLDLAADVARLHQGESACLHQGEVVRLQFLSEPVPHEDDPGKLNKSHADEDEDEEDDLDVPTRHRPSHGPDPGPRRKGPPAPLSIKPICNDDCACCYKTKNKLPRDDASPTSPPPTAS